MLLQLGFSGANGRRPLTKDSHILFRIKRIGVSLDFKRNPALLHSHLCKHTGTIEGIFNVEFLPKSIYFISDMPSDPRMSDIIPIALFSFLLSLAATLYPSWRAARTQPAEALRYE